MTGGEAEQEEGGDRLWLQVQASRTLSPNSPFSVTTSDESIHGEASAHVLRLPLHSRASSEPPHRSPWDTITNRRLSTCRWKASPSLPLFPSLLPLHPVPTPSSYSSSFSFRRPRAPVSPRDAVFLCVLHTGLPPTQKLVCPLP